VHTETDSTTNRIIVTNTSATSIAEHPRAETVLEKQLALGTPWITVVWNDPVNLMSYVSYVFRSYFGFSRDEAERLMLNVHNDGKATVAHGTREEMERHVEAMHDFGLWATLTKVDA
jgi:ATP-dependent Clp protease adaptor protein ClpS